MKKISILLAGALLLCGCQRALIQPDSVKAIYVQADFETERTPVSGSLQDDLLEVLSSLSFASAEAEETPEASASMWKRKTARCPSIAAMMP